VREIVFFVICLLIVNVFAGADIQDTNNAIPDSLFETAQVRIGEGMVFGEFLKDDGPFVISGNVIIPSGEKLEFGPGSLIFVDGEAHTTINVYGRIVFNGNADEPVIIRSIKKKPGKMEWDGIYCRSGELSEFNHCTISNSTFGVMIENGNVSIRNCIFSDNSNFGLSVANSDVTIDSTIFTGGHNIAIYLKTGARVTAENLTVIDNLSGILCESGSLLKFTGGSVTKNINGIITDKNASVTMVASGITLNKKGVVTNIEIPRRSRDMVFNNFKNIETVTDDKLHEYVTDQKKNAALPGIIIERTTSDFNAGFTAMSVPVESNSSFIGNVITGFSLYKPKSFNHPTDLDSSINGSDIRLFPASRKQTKYTGEHTDKWYGGIQPELQAFINGRRGAADINLILDMYGDNWLSTSNYIHKNIFNLTMSYNKQVLTFGDFFENGSETSIFGRAITGMRYSGGFFEMGNGVKRVDFKLSAGETEIPKDRGDHELNIFNVEVDSGSAIRQQITYLAALDIRPVKNVSIGLKGIIAREQDSKPFLRKEITDTSIGNPMEAQTGCLDAAVELFNSKVEIKGEFDLGSADTVPDGQKNNIAWYNPQIEDAVPEVFGLFKSENIDDHYAGTVQIKTKLNKSAVGLLYQQIGEDYFSAGNPYLEIDKRELSLNAERLFANKILGSVQISNEYLSTSTDPLDRGELNLDAEYTSEKTGLNLSVNYTGRFEKCDKTEYDSAKSGSFSSLQFCNIAGFETKQSFKNGISYSFRYQLLSDMDLSDHPIDEYNGVGDRLQNVWSAAFAFKIQKTARNKTAVRFATKSDNRDSLHAISGKIADQLYIDIIKGKLSLKLTGEYNWKKEKKYVDMWLSPCITKMYSANAEVRYSFTSRLSLSVNGGYEKSYDEISGSTDNYRVGLGGLHLTYLF